MITKFVQVDISIHLDMEWITFNTESVGVLKLPQFAIDCIQEIVPHLNTQEAEYSYVALSSVTSNFDTLVAVTLLTVDEYNSVRQHLAILHNTLPKGDATTVMLTAHEFNTWFVPQEEK